MSGLILGGYFLKQCYPTPSCQENTHHGTEAEAAELGGLCQEPRAHPRRSGTSRERSCPPGTAECGADKKGTGLVGENSGHWDLHLHAALRAMFMEFIGISFSDKRNKTKKSYPRNEAKEVLWFGFVLLMQMPT